MEAVTRGRILLYLAACAFAFWIGYLFYLVMMHDRPEFQADPLSLHKPAEIVVSRSQLLQSDLVVSARVEEMEGPAEVDEIVRRWQGADEPAKGTKLTLSNLAQCRDAHGARCWTGPGRYLIPLVRRGKDYFVTPLPPSPGFLAGDPGKAGPPRIYPDRDDTRKQVEQWAP